MPFQFSSSAGTRVAPSQTCAEMSEAAPAEYLDEAPLDGATTPTFYGTGRSKEQWSPTKVTACSQVGISGGFNMKPFSCPVMKLDCPPHGELLFVETSINAPWFRHGIAGKSAPDKGGISSAVQVLADMHRWLDDTIAAPVAGERPPSASESQGDSQEPVRNEGQDPMDELDFTEDSQKPPCHPLRLKVQLDKKWKQGKPKKLNARARSGAPASKYATIKQ